MNIFFILLLNVISYGKFTNDDLYCSIAGLEELLETMDLVQWTLSNYIEQEKFVPELLIKYLSYYNRELEKALKNYSEYLYNPINDYILIKRLTVDWQNIQFLIGNNTDQDYSVLEPLKSRKFPSQADLKGVITGLIRLQNVYELNTTLLANGIINGIQYSTELTSDDCFQIGIHCYRNKNYAYAASWLKEAFQKYQPSEIDIEKLQMQKILQHLIVSLYMKGSDWEAMSTAKLLLDMYPNDEIVKQNYNFLLQLKKSKIKIKRQEDNKDLDIGLSSNDEYLKLRHKQLCRNQIQLPASIGSRLRCRYVNYGKPFLLLAPLKEEEAYVNGNFKILLFREVLYPAEIRIIRELARFQLSRSKGVNKNTGEVYITRERTSKLAWLDDWLHPVLLKLNRRIEDMTSLSLSSAENLQVANYGVGGHYNLHHDFLYEVENKTASSTGIKKNNRIATVLFYMSTVYGGATVFPHLDLAVWPEEGSAVFWYNLHSSGNPNYRTLHAACPVLIGSKWGINKWIHEEGQEFLRLCSPSDV